MGDRYGNHADYIEWVKHDADARQEIVEGALRGAFRRFIEPREVEVVLFSQMSALDLADALFLAPLILKPLLAACNIAARAIERDLSIRNVDTYKPRLTADEAKVVAGYIKPFLPAYLAIPALGHIDRMAFIDKEIRKAKGRWEKRVLAALNQFASTRFRKRIFVTGGEGFELDAAAPDDGPITTGIDVKRIEARRDIHKRCDEIVNKSSKLQAAYPGSKFGAVIYYPFVEEHANVQNRLHSKNIGGIVFAAESTESIENAVRMLLSTLGVPLK